MVTLKKSTNVIQNRRDLTPLNITEVLNALGLNPVVKSIASGTNGLNITNSNIISTDFLVYWGQISGSLLTQTDLSNIIDNKANITSQTEGICFQEEPTSGLYNLNVRDYDEVKLPLTNNVTINLINLPDTNKSKVITLKTEPSSTITSNLSLPNDWNIYGTFLPDEDNILSIEVNNFGGVLEIDCFIDSTSSNDIITFNDQLVMFNDQIITI